MPRNKKEFIPHICWALLNQHKHCPLFKKNPHQQWMYFVHSYYAVPTDHSDLAAIAAYGESNVTAIVWKSKLGACQFHPEKSSKAGQIMLKRWINWLDSGAPISK